MSIEKVGNKCKVKLRVSGNKRGGSQKLAAVQEFCIRQNLFGALKEISCLERGSRANVRGQLVEKNGIVLSILDIRRKVVDSILSVSSF